MKNPCFENHLTYEKAEKKEFILYDAKAKGLFLKEISKISWH